jgi:hypothetical protein
MPRLVKCVIVRCLRRDEHGDNVTSMCRRTMHEALRTNQLAYFYALSRAGVGGLFEAVSAHADVELRAGEAERAGGF